MSENGWPHDDHHDGDQHHDFGEQPVDDLGTPEEALPVHEDDSWEAPDQPDSWAEHHDEQDAAQPESEDTPAELHDDAAAHDEPPVSDEPIDLFPPAVDVGPLPEPVLDGFPWIDTGSLGLIDAGVIDAGVADPSTMQQTPEPAELAEYAAEELPPAVDPWAALAESEDPATAALAKFYRPDQI